MRPASRSLLVVLALLVTGCDEPDATSLRATPLGAEPSSPSSLTPAPSPIVNGTDVGTCGYASVGAYGYDPVNTACSLVLVAPDVILTAAHCLAATGSPTEVHFGERYDQPAKVVPVESCASHPQYDGAWADIAVCVLAEPVEDIAITPILAGCELDLMVPGTPLEVVGFGASSALYDPELPPDFPFEVGGVGFKRKTLQTLEAIFLDVGQVWMLGDPDLLNSACFGDSGGPVFVTLPEGETRVVGLGQQIHPENPNPDPCGYGIVYQLVTPHIAWLEATTGRDLTPCWSGEAWTPGPSCQGFARQPELEVGTWASGCIGGGLGGVPQPQCEAMAGEDDTSSSDTGESEGTSETESGAETSETEGTSESGSEGTSDDELGDELGTGPSESGTDAGIDWEPDGRGCDCRASGGASGPLGLLALALLGLARRREPR